MPESSNKKAVIKYDKLNIDYLKEYNVDYLDYFLSSGEEFALLFTVEKSQAAYLKKSIYDNLKISIYEIGRIEHGEGLYLEKDRQMQRISSSGYQHFK